MIGRATPGIKWDASNEDKLGAIIGVLSEAYPGLVRWRELLSRVKQIGVIKSKITLQLYLTALKEKGLIEEIRRSRRQVYYRLSRRVVDESPLLKHILEVRKASAALCERFVKQVDLPEDRLRDYIYILFSHIQLILLTTLSWPTVDPMERSFIRNRLVPEYVDLFVELIGECWKRYPEAASDALAYITYTFLRHYKDLWEGKRIVPTSRIDLDRLQREGVITREQVEGFNKALQRKKFRKYAYYLRTSLTLLSWMKQALAESSS